MAKRKAAPSRSTTFSPSPEVLRLRSMLQADDEFLERKFLQLDTTFMRMSAVVYDDEVRDTVHIYETLWKLTRNMREITERALEALEAPAPKP